MGDNLSCSRLHTICALCEYAARRCAYNMQAFETAHYMCPNTQVDFVSKTAGIIVTGLSHNLDNTRDKWKWNFQNLVKATLDTSISPLRCCQKRGRKHNTV